MNIFHCDRCHLTHTGDNITKTAWDHATAQHGWRGFILLPHYITLTARPYVIHTREEWF